MEVVTIDVSMAKMVRDIYSHAYWTDKRNENDIKEMIKNTSLTVGILNKETNELIAFARVLTDYIYIAVITDVIVHTDYRKFGIGKMLMDAIVDYEQLKNVQQLELYCKDELMGFYKKWGFEAQNGYLNFMRKYNKKDF